jgi:hypothetical protein
MREDQWADQQDPEQRIAELERRAEEANRVAGRPPLTNAPRVPPPWPNASGPYGFSPPSASWGEAPPGAYRSRSRQGIPVAIAIIAGIMVVGIAIAVFYLSTPSRNGPGGGSSPATSAAMPNQPTLTKRFSDESYKAYGEVPIPGNKTLHLPAGQVAIFFHAETPSAGFGPLSIPDLKFNIDPPTGVGEPDVTESIGGTTSVDNVGWRRVWIAQIPQDGDYKISTDGKVGPFIWARLAFGHIDDQ